MVFGTKKFRGNIWLHGLFFILKLCVLALSTYQRYLSKLIEQKWVYLSETHMNVDVFSQTRTDNKGVTSHLKQDRYSRSYDHRQHTKIKIKNNYQHLYLNFQRFRQVVRIPCELLNTLISNILDMFDEIKHLQKPFWRTFKLFSFCRRQILLV